MRKRLAAWILFVALIAGVAYASNYAVARPSEEDQRTLLYHWSTAINELVIFVVIVGVTFAIAGGRNELLALRRPESWRRALLLCVIAFIVVYPLTSLLDVFLHGGREQGLTPKSWEPSHADAYAANFVVVGAIAPFAEELLFRGLGFSLVRGIANRWVTIITIGVAFGVYHGLLRALAELAIFGCALAWLRSRTQSVFPGMLLHATFNSLALVLAVTV